jgi:hypothetical protein
MKLKSGFVFALSLICLISPAIAETERAVYPQAVIGPAGDDSFDIELFLGNRNNDEPWSGVIRLLKSDDLTGFASVTFIDEDGKQTTVNNGQRSVTIPAGRSLYYRMKSSTFQVGVMVIESETSSIDDLVPSFFYKLINKAGQVIDIVGITAVHESSTGFRVMMTDTGTSNVGVAMVSSDGISDGSGPTALDEIEVTFTAFLSDGSEVSGTVKLGGSEAGHKALFPFQVIPNLPTGITIAQLKIRSTANIYVTTLAIVTPGESQDIQFAAVPALIDIDVPASGLSVDTQDRADVVRFWSVVYRASENVEMNFTGNVSTCDPGTTSPLFKLAVLRRINWFRAMAGLPGDIVLDDELNQKCQAAALIMAAQGALSHFPPSNWSCYTPAGDEAAGAANLHLTTSPNLSASLVDGYIEDPGQFNDVVGHRRWLLFTRQRVMGTGSVSGTNSANAIWVIGQFGTGPSRNHSWPPAGYVPYQVVYPRWSFSSPNADFSQATVTMTRGGSPISLSLNPVEVGFGDNTIIWEPSGIPSTAPSSDTSYEVTISNVLVGGSPMQFKYTVILIDPDK